LWGGEFWTRGYYIGTVGEHGSKLVIREFASKLPQERKNGTVKQEEREGPQEGMGILEFQQRFATDDACRDHLFRIR